MCGGGDVVKIVVFPRNFVGWVTCASVKGEESKESQWFFPRN